MSPARCVNRHSNNFALHNKDVIAVKAVIDRFEGKYAVLLFGDDEAKVDILRELLPGDAKEGDILNVSFEVDKAATQAQREKIEGLLQKLRNKNKLT